jgi:hypothetical protein
MTGSNSARARIPFLVLGCLFGVLWYSNRNMLLWEHALRMLVIMIVVLAVIELLARRRTGRERGPRLAHGRIIAAKLGLLAVAVVAEWLLDHWTAQASAIVAVGLAALTAVFGPGLQRHLVSASAPRGSDDVPVRSRRAGRRRVAPPRRRAAVAGQAPRKRGRMPTFPGRRTRLSRGPRGQNSARGRALAAGVA